MTDQATRDWLRSEIDFLATRRRVLRVFADMLESTASGTGAIDVHAALGAAGITAGDVADQAAAVTWPGAPKH